jgi:hypothetical protein
MWGSAHPGHAEVTTGGDHGPVPFLFAPRRLALLTAVSAALVVWALAERSLLAVPLSVVFVLVAFGWSLARLHVQALPAAPAGLCRGCRAGCVDCRERIDSPA